MEARLSTELAGSTVEMVRLSIGKSGPNTYKRVGILVAAREASGAIVAYKCPVFKNLTDSIECRKFDRQEPISGQNTVSVISMLAQGGDNVNLRVAYSVYDTKTKTSTSVRRTYTYSVAVDKEEVVTETELVFKSTDEIFLTKSTLLIAEANSPGVIALSSESKVQAYQAELVLVPTSAPVFYIFYPTDPSLVSPDRCRVLVDERAAVLVVATESALYLQSINQLNLELDVDTIKHQDKQLVVNFVTRAGSIEKQGKVELATESLSFADTLKRDLASVQFAASCISGLVSRLTLPAASVPFAIKSPTLPRLTDTPDKQYFVRDGQGWKAVEAVIELSQDLAVSPADKVVLQCRSTRLLKTAKHFCQEAVALQAGIGTLLRPVKRYHDHAMMLHRGQDGVYFSIFYFGRQVEAYTHKLEMKFGPSQDKFIDAALMPFQKSRVVVIYEEARFIYYMGVNAMTGIIEDLPHKQSEDVGTILAVHAQAEADVIVTVAGMNRYLTGKVKN